MIVNIDLFGTILTLKGEYIPKREAITYPPERVCPPDAAMFEIERVDLGNRDITELLNSFELYLDTFREEDIRGVLTGQSLFNYLEDEVIKELENSK